MRHGATLGGLCGSFSACRIGGEINGTVPFLMMGTPSPNPCSRDLSFENPVSRCATYSTIFRCTQTLFTTPSANMIISTNDPLYDINGNGTPVIGNIPTIIPAF
jgi:hypothetical protein